MKYYVLLPKNFLFKRKGSTITASTAVAATIFVLVFSNVVFSGLFDGIMEEGTDLLFGHVQITDTKASMIDTPTNLLLAMLSTNRYVLGAAPRITLASEINHTTSGGLKSKYGVQTFGVDPLMEKDATKLASTVVQGSFQLTPSQYSILLGANLAMDLDAEVGDVVTLRFGVSEDIPVEKNFRVVGVFTSGPMMALSDAALVHIEVMRKMVGLKNSDASTIIVRLVDPTYSEEVKQWIQQSFPLSELEIQTITEVMGEFMEGTLTVMTFINLVGYVGLFAAALGVITILTMLVTGKTRDIGVLRAIGLQKKGVLLVFIVAGAMIGFFGAIAGGLAGAAFTLYLQEYPAAFAFGIPLRVEFSLNQVLFPMLIGFLMSVLSSIYPAWKASGFEPAEAMRYF